MIYEIEAFDEDAGFFSNANDKLAKEFNKIAKNRVNDGWTLHSYDTVGQGKTIYCTSVWYKE
jgi:hypothetical protein